MVILEIKKRIFVDVVGIKYKRNKSEIIRNDFYH